MKIKSLVPLISAVMILSALPVLSVSAADPTYESLLFTVADVVFFSYEDDTTLELYDSSNVLIWNNGGTPLDKGEHASVTVSQGVYRAVGSKKFAVLSGDPISNYVVGYYAMDQDGYGASTEIYTWVPQLYSHCKFIVFAYQDDTDITVEYTDTGVDIATFTLDKGEHWDIETLDTEWLHVTADKPVSALTCYDQGYFVPSATGRWSGTEFYTYVSDIMGWAEDLTVISYNDYTSVEIRDSDTNVLIWSGTLDDGEAHVEQYPSGADQFFTITSSDTVTVSVQPWKSMTGAYHQGAYVQDRDGAGIGTDLIGSTLNGGYLHILAYNDDTDIDVYNSQTGVWIASYNLDKGESVNANPGNGLWRIISDKPVSSYSGWGSWNADFAPVEFGEIVTPEIYPTDDSYTDERIPYRNYGTATTLWAYHKPYPIDRYMWLKFDLSGVSTVTSATLVLHPHSSGGSPRTCDRIFGVHYSNDDSWDETSITWNNQPGFDADPEDTVTNPVRCVPIEFDVTSIVQSEVTNGEQFISFVVKSEENCYMDWLSAYSSNYPDDTLWPYLDIE